MSGPPMPPTNATAREQTSTLRRVGPYTVHLAFFDRRTRAAVSRRGQIVHRGPDIDTCVAWAVNRLKEIHSGQGRKDPA